MKSFFYAFYIAILVAAVTSHSYWMLAGLVGIKGIFFAALGGLMGVGATAGSQDSTVMLIGGSIAAIMLSAAVVGMDLMLAFGLPWAFRIFQASLA